MAEESSIVKAEKLCLASQAGDLEQVVRLLGQGFDPNLKHRGQAALIYACENGHHQIAEVLLNNGALVDQGDSYGQSALHWTARRGQARCAQLLVSRGADVNLRSRMGDSPADVATHRLNLEVRRAIINGLTGDYEPIDPAKALQLQKQQQPKTEVPTAPLCSSVPTASLPRSIPSPQAAEPAEKPVPS
eukprot:RCo020488